MGYLGESDDKVDPRSADFQQSKVKENYQPLFIPNVRAAYPYWDDESGRETYTSMPNTRITLGLATRAARRTAINLINRHPDRYAKYKYLLMRMLMRCSVLDEGRKIVQGAYEKENPARVAKWASILNDSLEKDKVAKEKKLESGMQENVRRAYELMLVDFLGVPPDDMLLIQPKPKEDVLETAANYNAFCDAYVGRSPLQYNSSAGRLCHYIPGHLTGIDAPDFAATTEISHPSYHTELDPKLTARFSLKKNLENPDGCKALKIAYDLAIIPRTSKSRADNEVPANPPLEKHRHVNPKSGTTPPTH